MKSARLQATAVLAALMLSACAGGPPPPDWQLDAKAALDDGVNAYLSGDTRAAERGFERARAALARTGRPALMARAELMRCAARVASLEFEPCAGFERWRADADATELAYADYLEAKPLGAEAIKLLPTAQQAVANLLARGTAAVPAAEDPLSRLIGAAVLLRAGRSDAVLAEQATATASAQGWRRPLLAWLELQARAAERSGDMQGAAALRRRSALVLEGR